MNPPTDEELDRFIKNVRCLMNTCRDIMHKAADDPKHVANGIMDNLTFHGAWIQCFDSWGLKVPSSPQILVLVALVLAAIESAKSQELLESVAIDGEEGAD